MNVISFMTANYVARQTNYNMTQGWGQGDRATNEYFRPLDTFAERFEELLRDVRAMDFKAIDLWLAHLHPDWATGEHIAIAADLLTRYELPVVSLAGGFGSTPEAFERSCRLATALECTILGGSTNMLEKDRSFVVKTLKKYGLALGIENHPEKTPEEVLEKIGDGGEGTIGTALDTGWFGTQGYSAPQAIRDLQEHVVHIHLKDVLSEGMPHETCRYGEGIVPIEECVRTLRAIGYQGPISVEHEPEHSNPTDDIRASRDMLQRWMRQDGNNE